MWQHERRSGKASAHQAHEQQRAVGRENQDLEILVAQHGDG